MWFNPITQAYIFILHILVGLQISNTHFVALATRAFLTNFGSLIPNAASVFVVDIRISEKKIPQILKKRLFDPLGGPALQILGGPRFILMHEINRYTSILKYKP